VRYFLAYLQNAFSHERILVKHHSYSLPGPYVTDEILRSWVQKSRWRTTFLINVILVEAYRSTVCCWRPSSLTQLVWLVFSVGMFVGLKVNSQIVLRWLTGFHTELSVRTKRTFYQPCPDKRVFHPLHRWRWQSAWLWRPRHRPMHGVSFTETCRRNSCAVLL